MPANDDLALLNNDLVVAGVGRQTRLAKALTAVADDYDDLLIDCPPSLNLLTVNALVAAHQLAHQPVPSSDGAGHPVSSRTHQHDRFSPSSSR